MPPSTDVSTASTTIGAARSLHVCSDDAASLVGSSRRSNSGGTVARLDGASTLSTAGLLWRRPSSTTPQSLTHTSEPRTFLTPSSEECLLPQSPQIKDFSSSSPDTRTILYWSRVAGSAGRTSSSRCKTARSPRVSEATLAACPCRKNAASPPRMRRPASFMCTTSM